MRGIGKSHHPLQALSCKAAPAQASYPRHSTAQRSAGLLTCRVVLLSSSHGDVQWPSIGPVTPALHLCCLVSGWVSGVSGHTEPQCLPTGRCNC